MFTLCLTLLSSSFPCVFSHVSCLYLLPSLSSSFICVSSLGPSASCYLLSIYSLPFPIFSASSSLIFAIRDQHYALVYDLCSFSLASYSCLHYDHSWGVFWTSPLSLLCLGFGWLAAGPFLCQPVCCHTPYWIHLPLWTVSLCAKPVYVIMDLSFTVLILCCAFGFWLVPFWCHIYMKYFWMWR